MVRKTFLVKPNAKTHSIGRSEDGSLWIRIAAPPSEGKANEAILRFLAKTFAIPKSSCTLLSGAASRFKTFELDVSVEEFEKVLSKTGSIG
jgi:uncharacterized protein (TIGR00251 family)